MPSKSSSKWSFQKHNPEDKADFKVLEALQKDIKSRKTVNAETFAKYILLSNIVYAGEEEFKKDYADANWSVMNTDLNYMRETNPLFYNLLEQCKEASLEKLNLSYDLYRNMRIAVSIGASHDRTFNAKWDAYKRYRTHFDPNTLLEMEKKHTLIDPKDVAGSMERVCALQAFRSLSVNIAAYYDLHKDNPYLVDSNFREDVKKYNGIEEIQQLAMLSGQEAMNTEKTGIQEAERKAEENYEVQKKEEDFRAEVIARGGDFGDWTGLHKLETLNPVNEYHMQQLHLAEADLSRARNMGYLNTDALKKFDDVFNENLKNADLEYRTERHGVRVTSILIMESMQHIADAAIKASADFQGELSEKQRRAALALMDIVIMTSSSPYGLAHTDELQLQHFCMLKLMCAAAAAGPYAGKGLMIDAKQLISNPEYRDEQLDLLMAQDEVKKALFGNKNLDELRELAKKSSEEIFNGYDPDMTKIPLWMNENAHRRFSPVMEQWKDQTPQQVSEFCRLQIHTLRSTLRRMEMLFSAMPDGASKRSCLSLTGSCYKRLISEENLLARIDMNHLPSAFALAEDICRRQENMLGALMRIKEPPYGLSRLIERFSAQAAAFTQTLPKDALQKQPLKEEAEQQEAERLLRNNNVFTEHQGLDGLNGKNIQEKMTSARNIMRLAANTLQQAKDAGQLPADLDALQKTLAEGLEKAEDLFAENNPDDPSDIRGAAAACILFETMKAVSQECRKAQNVSADQQLYDIRGQLSTAVGQLSGLGELLLEGENISEARSLQYLVIQKMILTAAAEGGKKAGLLGVNTDTVLKDPKVCAAKAEALMTDPYLTRLFSNYSLSGLQNLLAQNGAELLEQYDPERDAKEREAALHGPALKLTQSQQQENLQLIQRWEKASVQDIREFCTDMAAEMQREFDKLRTYRTHANQLPEGEFNLYFGKVQSNVIGRTNYVLERIRDHDSALVALVTMNDVLHEIVRTGEEEKQNIEFDVEPNDDKAFIAGEIKNFAAIENKFTAASPENYVSTVKKAEIEAQEKLEQERSAANQREIKERYERDEREARWKKIEAALQREEERNAQRAKDAADRKQQQEKDRIEKERLEDEAEKREDEELKNKPIGEQFLAHAERQRKALRSYCLKNRVLRSDAIEELNREGGVQVRKMTISIKSLTWIYAAELYAAAKHKEDLSETEQQIVKLVEAGREEALINALWEDVDTQEVLSGLRGVDFIDMLDSASSPEIVRRIAEEIESARVDPIDFSEVQPEQPKVEPEEKPVPEKVVEEEPKPAEKPAEEKPVPEAAPEGKAPAEKAPEEVKAEVPSQPEVKVEAQPEVDEDAEFERVQAEKSRIRAEENKVIREDAEKYSRYSGLFGDIFIHEDYNEAADYLYSYGLAFADNYKKIIEPLDGSEDFKEYKKIYSENQEALMKKLGHVAPDSEEVRLDDVTIEIEEAAGYNIADSLSEVYKSGEKYGEVLKNAISTAYEEERFESITDQQILQLQAIGKAAFLHELLTEHLHPNHEEAMRRRMVNAVILSAAAKDLRSNDAAVHRNALRLLTDPEYRHDLQIRLRRDPEFMKRASEVLNTLKVTPEEAADSRLFSCAELVQNKEHTRIAELEKRKAEEAARKEQLRLHEEKYKELKQTAAKVKVSPNVDEYSKISEELAGMGGVPIDVLGYSSFDQLTDLLHVYTASLADALKKMQDIQSKSGPNRILPFKAPEKKLNKLYAYLNAENRMNRMIILKAAADIYHELEKEKAAFAKSRNEKQLFTYDQLDQLTVFNSLGSPEQVFNNLRNPGNIMETAARAMNLKINHLLKADPKAALTDPQFGKALLYPNVFNDLIAPGNIDKESMAAFDQVRKPGLNDAEFMKKTGMPEYRASLYGITEEIIKADKNKVLEKVMKRDGMTPDKLKQLLKKDIRVLKKLSPEKDDINLQNAEILADAANPDEPDSVKAAVAAYFDACTRITGNFRKDFAVKYSNPKSEDYPAIVKANKFDFTASLINHCFIDLNSLFALKARVAMKMICTDQMNKINSGELSLKDSLLSPDKSGSMQNRDKAVSGLQADPDFKAMIKDADENALKKLLVEDDQMLLEKYNNIRNERLAEEEKKRLAEEQQKKIDAEKQKQQEPFPEVPKEPVVQKNLKPEEGKPPIPEKKQEKNEVENDYKNEDIIRTDVKPEEHIKPAMSEKDQLDDSDDQIILKQEENKKPGQPAAQNELSSSALIGYFNLIKTLNDELHTTNHTWTDSEWYTHLKEGLDSINNADYIPAKFLYDAVKAKNQEDIQKYKGILTKKLTDSFEQIAGYCDDYVLYHQPTAPKTYADLKLSETQRERLAVICELKQVCNAFKANTDPTSAAFSKERAAMKVLTGLAVRTLELRIDTANQEYGIKEDGIFRHVLLDEKFRLKNMPTNHPVFKRMCEDQKNIYKEKKYPARKHLIEPGPEKLERDFYKEFASRDKKELLKLFISDKYNVQEQKHQKDNRPAGPGLKM